MITDIFIILAITFVISSVLMLFVIHLTEPKTKSKSVKQNKCSYCDTLYNKPGCGHSFHV